MAELDAKFEAAVGVIQGLPKDGSFQPSNEMKLKFYGFYKQAREGPCNGARPSFWDVVARAKYDAWNELGDMSSVAAKEGYIEALKQIIETINLNSDVEKFIEVLGPFYEYVSEDKLMAGNPQLVKTAQASQATLKELHRHDLEVGGRVSLGEEEDLEKMLGHFVDGEGGGSGRDVNENWEEHGDLMKEIRWTKENLDQTMQLLKDCVNDNEAEKSQGLVADNVRREEDEVEVGKNGFTKMEIGRLLDNMDGYVAPRDGDGIATKSLSSISSPPLFSCEEESDQESDLFEDSTDGVVEEMQVSPDVQHVDVQVISNPACQEGSSVYESSPETGLPHPPTETRIPQPPSAPLKHCVQQPGQEEESVVEEEDEILIVSTSSNLHQQLSTSSHQLSHVHHTADPIQAAVERMAGDMEHLRARVSSLETILSLRSKLDASEQNIQSWWPLPGLNSRTLLFVVTWPLLAQGLFYLARGAMGRSRR